MAIGADSQMYGRTARLLGIQKVLHARLSWIYLDAFRSGHSDISKHIYIPSSQIITELLQLVLNSLGYLDLTWLIQARLPTNSGQPAPAYMGAA